ncbi:hypothetical protein Gohar_010972, partial [Gossypium harknessii]|nr:hypothetical protein [Gossypium harknessii]
ANADTYTNTKNANDPDQTDEEALIRYLQKSDFRRDIIKGSMSAQRRKTITWELNTPSKTVSTSSCCHSAAMLLSSRTGIGNLRRILAGAVIAATNWFP